MINLDLHPISLHRGWQIELKVQLLVKVPYSEAIEEPSVVASVRQKPLVELF